MSYLHTILKVQLMHHEFLRTSTNFLWSCIINSLLCSALDDTFLRFHTTLTILSLCATFLNFLMLGNCLKTKVLELQKRSSKVTEKKINLWKFWVLYFSQKLRFLNFVSKVTCTYGTHDLILMPIHCVGRFWHTNF